MSDEQVQPSPMQWARMIEDTTNSIMRHTVMPAVMDRVDTELVNLVTIVVSRLIEPETERQMVTLAQENKMLRAIVDEVFKNAHDDLDVLELWLSTPVVITADQLALIRRIVGLDES